MSDMFTFSDQLQTGDTTDDEGDAVAGYEVERIDRDEQRVLVNRTKDEIKGAPEFNEARFHEPGYREQLSGYYK